MKNIPAAIETILAENEKQPVHLYRITMTNMSLRYAASKQSIEFPTGGDTWNAKAVKHETPMRSIHHSRVGKAKISFADGNQFLFGVNKNDPMKGKMIEVLRVYRNALGSNENYVSIMMGRIANVSWNYQWFVVEMTVGSSRRTKQPRRSYNTRCLLTPGGIECNEDGNFDITQTPFKQTGTANGSGSTFTDAGRGEANDYWTHGRILIEDGSDLYDRKVTAFSSGEFTLDFPTRITSAKDVSYTIYRGCDGSWAACSGNKAFGPSADNHDNYGGFLHIRETERG